MALVGSDMALISIILPFTSEKEWLKEAIESIIAQTYTAWELILVANCAEEASVRIAQNHTTDPRIRLIHEDNPGIAHALNSGICAAGGQLIARMDADDRCHPERLALQASALLDSPHINAVSCRTDHHPDGPPGEGFSAYMAWQNSIQNPQEHLLNRFIESPLAHPTLLFKRTLIDQLGYYHTGDLPEDYELILRWLQAGMQIFKLPQKLYQWRDHENRLSRTGFAYTKQHFHKVRFKYLALELKKNPGLRPVILCGGKSLRKKAEQSLEDSGIQIAGFSDVVQTAVKDKIFIPANEIGKHKDCFFISITGGRGKSSELRSFFISKGLREGEDFILAA